MGRIGHAREHEKGGSNSTPPSALAGSGAVWISRGPERARDHADPSADPGSGRRARNLRQVRTAPPLPMGHATSSMRGEGRECPEGSNIVKNCATRPTSGVNWSYSGVGDLDLAFLGDAACAPLLRESVNHGTQRTARDPSIYATRRYVQVLLLSPSDQRGESLGSEYRQNERPPSCAQRESRSDATPLGGVPPVEDTKSGPSRYPRDGSRSSAAVKERHSSVVHG